MSKMRVLLLFVLLVLSVHSWGQVEENPFDLDLQLDTEEAAPLEAPPTSTNPFDLDLPLSEAEGEAPPPIMKIEEPEPVLADSSGVVEQDSVHVLPSDNPFDLSVQPTEEAIKPRENSISSEPKSLELQELWIPVPETSHDLSQLGRGIFLLFLGILLAILNTLFRSDLQRVWRTFGSLNQANFNYRQLSGTFRWSTLLFFLFFFLSGGLFLYFLMMYFGVQLSIQGWAAVAALIGFLIIITLGRMLVLSFIRGVFPFGQEVGFFQFNITQFNFVIGLVLFPMVVALAFVQEQLHQVIIWIAVIAIAGIYLFRTIRGLFIARQYLVFHKFHFFLYLCTVEIAPLVILLRLVTNWSSVS